MRSFSIFRQHWKYSRKNEVKFWILLKYYGKWSICSKRANAPFSIIFSNPWYFKSVKSTIDKLGVFHANQISMFLDPHLNWGWGCCCLLGLSPSVKYFTDRSKAVLLLWIFYVFALSCVCYVFVRICLYVLCDHLLGKGWPLGSRFWCLNVILSLSHWYPGSGVVLILYRFLIFAPILT